MVEIEIIDLNISFTCELYPLTFNEKYLMILGKEKTVQFPHGNSRKVFVKKTFPTNFIC